VNNKQILKKRIEQTELQLKRLSNQTTKNEVCEDLINSLIMQKAILKKEYEDLTKNKVVEFVKKKLPRKEKLICDYFG